MVAAIDAVEQYDSTAASNLMLLPFRDDILRAARKYRLPAALIAGVIQQESLWNEWAERTEPAYLRNAQIRREAQAWSRRHKGIPSVLTEIMDRARSMGLMQPMGEVAREQGDTDQYLSSLFLPRNSIDQGAKKLKSYLVKYKGDTLAAISAYNAGTAHRRHGAFTNARYVYRVLAGYDAWKIFFQHYHSSLIHHDLYFKSEKNRGMARRHRIRHSNSGITASAGVQCAAAETQDSPDAARRAPVEAGFDYYPRHDTADTLAHTRASQLAGLRHDSALAIGHTQSYRRSLYAIWVVAGFCTLVLGYAYIDWRHRRNRPGYDEHLSRYDYRPLLHRDPTRGAKA